MRISLVMSEPDKLTMLTDSWCPSEGVISVEDPELRTKNDPGLQEIKPELFSIIAGD